MSCTKSVAYVFLTTWAEIRNIDNPTCIFAVECDQRRIFFWYPWNSVTVWLLKSQIPINTVSKEWIKKCILIVILSKVVTRVQFALQNVTSGTICFLREITPNLIKPTMTDLDASKAWSYQPYLVRFMSFRDRIKYPPDANFSCE